MKYPARFYSQALTALINEGKIKNQDEIVYNLISILKKNGDLKILPDIIKIAEKNLAKKERGRYIVIETARPIQNIIHMLRELIGPQDIVREEINPRLVAGVRIVIDDEIHIDASLRSELNSLLASRPTL